MTRLRVGLNLLFHGPRAGGIGTYARQLGAALAARDDVELHVFLATNAPPELTEMDWLDAVSVTRLPVAAGSLGAAVASRVVVPAIALARRLDVLHGPANSGATGIPGLACVVTLHDVIHRQAGTEWASPETIAMAERAMRRAAAKADVVLAISEAGAADLVAALGLPAERVAVAQLAVRPVHVTRAPEDPPFLLSVGQKRPYKDHALVIDALARLARDDVRLVLPGRGDLNVQLRAQADALGLGDRVELPGWVEDLDPLYAGAACVVQPSRFEGFGLPVLEGMAAGAPVVCSAIPAHREVAGDAALLFEPGDADACAALIERVLRDPGDLGERGRVHAAEWTWERCAEETVAAYRRAAA